MKLHRADVYTWLLIISTIYNFYPTFLFCYLQVAYFSGIDEFILTIVFYLQQTQPHKRLCDMIHPSFAFV